MLSIHIKRYLEHMRVNKRCQPLSVQNYGYTLTKFAREFDTLTSENVMEFLQGYDKATSANVALVRLQGLAEFMKVKLEVVKAREPFTSPEALSSQELITLLYRMLQDGDGVYADCALVLAKTGMRFHEFRNLGTDKTVIEKRDGIRYLKVLGKGQKLRTVVIKDDTFDVLKKINTAFIKTAGFAKQFRRALHQASVKADLPSVHPHMLRGTFASILLNEKRIDSVTVCKHGGWSSADTLMKRYYKPSLKALHDAL